jgi:hypothetical protein
VAGLTDAAIAQAMVANGRWSTRLGWDRYVDPIDVLLGASPGTLAPSAAFARPAPTRQLAWHRRHRHGYAPTGLRRRAAPVPRRLARELLPDRHRALDRRWLGVRADAMGRRTTRGVADAHPPRGVDGEGTDAVGPTDAAPARGPTHERDAMMSRNGRLALVTGLLILAGFVPVASRMRWPPIILEAAMTIALWAVVLKMVHLRRVRVAADPSPRGVRGYRLYSVALIAVALGVTWFSVWFITDGIGPPWLHTLSLPAALIFIAVGAIFSGYAGWVGGL